MWFSNVLDWQPLGPGLDAPSRLSWRHVELNRIGFIELTDLFLKHKAAEKQGHAKTSLVGFIKM